MAVRESAGGTRRGRRWSARRNTRRIVSAVPKPQPAATAAIGVVAVLQATPRGLQAHALDVARGRDAGLGAERAGEVARAHVRARCHRLDRVVAGDVLEHRALDLAQRLARAAAARRAWR